MSYPTPWQRKTIWSALTLLAIASIFGLAIGGIWLLSQTVAYLQPLLIPFAVAGVLTYLLGPVVDWMAHRKMPRIWAVVSVYVISALLFALVLTWVVPVAHRQVRGLSQRLPVYFTKARDLINQAAEYYKKSVAPKPDETTEATPTPFPAPEEVGVIPAPQPVETPAETAPKTDGPRNGFEVEDLVKWAQDQLPELQKQVPGVLARIWGMVQGSVGGFLGTFGFLLSLIIVPVYLFFLLLEGPAIAETWSNYLPLRRSEFKDELVSVLTEINGYLISFFRGQVLVSVIDGLLTGIALLCIGLDFALLIGLLLAVLGVIPYIGIIICWIPAALIAFAQWGDWQHVLWVTIIFTVVQQVDGIFIAPKIVGESVGLHPMTVIFSVFGWSLLLGGLLGAILAVPLTATIKVLLKRYVWEKRFRASQVVLAPGDGEKPEEPPETPQVVIPSGATDSVKTSENSSKSEK